MRLFHVTDDDGAAGIRAEGFGKSFVRDSQGSSWFADTFEETMTGRADRRWLIIVEMPDEVAEHYRHRLEDGTPYLGNFLIPFDVVNSYRPFAFELLH